MKETIVEAFKVLVFHTLHLRSRRAIEKWQVRYLRLLVTHAIKNVPLYAELYGKVGIVASGITSLKDLVRLPNTRKQTFVGRSSGEYIDNSRPVKQIWESTSGTSGVPFLFILGRNALEDRYLDSICFRFITWLQPWRMDFSRMKVARIKIRSHYSKYRMFIPVAEYLADPHAAVRSLAEFQPYVFESYASILLLLATELEQNPDLPRIRPAFLVSFGEALTEAARERLRRVFECDVYDRYGIEEMSVVACECTEHDGQHMHSESIIAEVVDESGTPLPDGEYGRIILTDLTNYSMPFIRYDSGDHGTISHETCACGLHTPRIWLEGRHSAFVTLSEKVFHHLEFDAALDTFMSVIQQYQLVKKGDARMAVRIVAGPHFESKRATVQRSLENLVGDHAEVEIEIVEAIPVTPRGKSKILVDESAL